MAFDIFAIFAIVCYVLLKYVNSKTILHLVNNLYTFSTFTYILVFRQEQTDRSTVERFCFFLWAKNYDLFLNKTFYQITFDILDDLNVQIESIIVGRGLVSRHIGL